ncbi:hypothetical protein KFL_001180350 [Klebsormidium nitens]|uniref:Late embryogenesis abundant protein n=1 Tax=Klebsormidium nitens TaxID=105231 RepID=A0A1Y1I1L8_KLENI|nr:hypothetical protein KFL_001180350 [Klebsormidium nitens]|eukprot:GAQ82656.1 hypothetical protein KFL_001180350 [Klebsormidium nitens]
MTLGHHNTNPMASTGLMGHGHHTTGTGLTGTGTGVTGHHHHGTGALGTGTTGTAGVAATDSGAHASAGASNMKATFKEKVAHVKADVVEAGQKLTHPTNPAYKMAATQESETKKAAATERKFQEQALAGANEHGKMANARQGVANAMHGHMGHTHNTTYNTNTY